MAKRDSTSPTHDRLAGLSLGEVALDLLYIFEALGNNSGPLPGVSGRVRLEAGAESANNRAGVSGGSVKYRSFENGDPADTTAVSNGYLEVTAGTKDILLTAQINTLGDNDIIGDVYWRNINGNNGAITGSFVGTFGQTTPAGPATVTVPAGQTVTYTVRHDPSAQNQVVQAGSFIRAEEV